MNPKERFNAIINEIERLVNGEEDQNGNITYLGKQEICDKAFVSAQCYLSSRERNTLFQFLLGKSVMEYISERKMMAAYKYLIEEKKGKTFQKAIEIAGVADQPGFIRKFKSQFYVTPATVCMKKDTTLLLPMPNWDLISGNDWFALEVARLMENYRLNERECALALELHRTYGMNLNEVFEYIYNYVWWYIEGKCENESERDTDIEFYLRDKNIIRMYFEYKFTLDAIFNILIAKEIQLINRKLEECEKKYLEGCLVFVERLICSQGFQFQRHRKEKITFYDENYQYYNQKSNEMHTYFDYILYTELCRFYDREKSFELVKPGHSSYESIGPQIEEEERIFEEKMYEEMEREFEKRFNEDEQRRYEEELEACEASYLEYLEQDMYEPDFGEEGYVSYYRSEEEYDYDYEPDFDEPEWLESEYLSLETEDFSFEDIIEEEMEAEYLKESMINEQALFFSYEDIDTEAFVGLCEKVEQDDNRKKLNSHYGFNVRQYLDDLEDTLRNLPFV